MSPLSQLVSINLNSLFRRNCLRHADLSGAMNAFYQHEFELQNIFITVFSIQLDESTLKGMRSCLCLYAGEEMLSARTLNLDTAHFILGNVVLELPWSSG